MTVYIDILFLFNWLVHMLLLILTGCLSGRELSPFRLITGSVFGALYSVLFMFPQLKVGYSIIYMVGFSFLIIGVSFRFRYVMQWIRTLLCFYLASFLMGGGVFAVLFVTGIGTSFSAVMVNGILYMDIPWYILLSAMVLCVLLVSFLGKTVRRSYEKEKTHISVIVENEGKEITLTALLDSGNHLKEPISGAPVITVDANKLNGFLTKEQINTILHYENIEHETKQTDKGLLLRLIPYRSVGVKNGLLVGFVPHKVILKNKHREILIKNAVIALSDGALSVDDSFDAIVDAAYVAERM